MGLVILEPDKLGTSQEIVLNGEGSARYRQFEATARATWKSGELTFSYTHANAQGSLNTYDTFLGNYPMPLIRPNVYSKLPADLPNRFLAWGHIDPHFWKFQLYPILEYRSGFPYARYDEAQNYAGIPYADATRFPRFFSADSRLVRDFKVNPKYTVRLSLTTYNMTNHFNALSVHNNTADPQYGIFFGNYHRRYRGDFEIVF